MNLKKTLTGTIASFALAATFMAPAGIAYAQTYSTDSGTGQVQVTSDGEFSVHICDSDVPITFASVGANTDTAVTTTGSLSICFVDTHVQRQGFLTMLSANDFTASGVATTIPATGLIPTVIYGPVAGQLQPSWKMGGHIFGDHNNSAAGHNVVEPVIAPASPFSEVWGGGSLSTAQQVGHGDSGRGTSHATQKIDMKLTVPNNTLPATYTNTITVDLTYRAP